MNIFSREKMQEEITGYFHGTKWLSVLDFAEKSSNRISLSKKSKSNQSRSHASLEVERVKKALKLR